MTQWTLGFIEGTIFGALALIAVLIYASLGGYK